MKRKVIGLVAALLLAAVGTLALVAYVKSAKDEAVSGEELVKVYVLDKSVPKGASAEDIRQALKEVEVPAKTRADAAITSLSDVGDSAVAAVDLEPGEQLLSTRLIAADSISSVTVPEGLQEVTLSLDVERAVGGTLRPGDTVGVVLSFDPFELHAGGVPVPADQVTTTTAPGSTETTLPKKTPNMTHLVLQQVLVTQVQVPTNDNSTPSTVVGNVSISSISSVLVTLALSSDDVEQVVFAAEFGHVWLTAQNSSTDPTGTRIVTLGTAIDAKALA